MAGAFRVTNDVYCVGGSGVSSSGDCMVYMIDTEKDQLILVDAGLSNPGLIIRNIESLGFEPKRITHHIITHSHVDHIGNSAKLKKMLKFKVYAHEPDARTIELGGVETGAALYNVSYEPVKVDVKLTKPMDVFALGKHNVRIMHIPGHTPGGVCPFIDLGGERVIFAQDVHGPLFEEFGSSRMDFVESLKKERDLNADILCEGHFGVIKGKEKVRKYIGEYISEFSR
jgi:glyoxylase-like metal-dependent hydrolase (beta-lactamase superfamily II)